MQQFQDRIRQISPQIEIVWANQPGWPVLYCSPNIERILGYSNAALVDGAVAYESLIHPQDLERVMKEVQAGLQGQQTCFSHQPYRLKAANGQYHWVEDRTFVERDDRGSATHMIGCLFEIDAQVANEHELRESRDRLELVLQGTRLGMWDWYPQTNDVVFDDRWAEMLGLTLADLDMVLDDWSSRVHPDDIDGCMADIQAHMEGKTDFYENLHRMRHSSGEWLYILDRGKIVERNAAGEPLRFTGTHTDVTPLKKAELAAQQALAARDRFFSAMSHELRTPMHAVLGLVELMLQRPESQPLQKDLTIVARNSAHLLNVLRDILDVAKLDSGEMSFSNEPIELEVQLESLIALFRARAESVGITLSLQLQSYGTWILVDRQRLMQVISNLVSNAIKYTPKGGKVVVGTQNGKLFIEDTGVGIADISRAFQPFVQEGQDHEANSTGLGLSIVKQLTEKMGLGMLFESEVGVGTRVELDYQALITSERREGEVQQAEVERPSWQAKLLIVDDNPTNLMVAQAMLGGTYIEIQTAEDGEQAVQACRDWQPDIVLMDLHMPILDGLHATKAIRLFNKSVQIIGLSADAFETAKQQGIEAGMDDYLVKPFGQEQIYQVLNQAALRIGIAG